jgi:hypothetical protein
MQVHRIERADWRSTLRSFVFMRRCDITHSAEIGVTTVRMSVLVRDLRAQLQLSNRRLYRNVGLFALLELHRLNESETSLPSKSS